MSLVLQIRNDGKDAIIIKHAGETLLIATAPGSAPSRTKVLLAGPTSFDITRGGTMTHKGD